MIKPIETIDMTELVDVRFVYELASPASNAPSKSALNQLVGYVDSNGQLYRIDRYGNLHKRTVTNANDQRKCYRVRIDGELFTIAIPQHKVDAAFKLKPAAKKQPMSSDDSSVGTWGYILYDAYDNVEETEVGYASENEALEAAQKEIKGYLEDSYDGYTAVVFRTTGKTVSATTKFSYE